MEQRELWIDERVEMAELELAQADVIQEERELGVAQADDHSLVAVG